MCKKVISAVLLLLWMAGIFLFSAQPAEESSKTSGRVERVIVSVLRFFGQDVPDAENMENLTFIVRKGAHLSLYFVLCLLCLNALGAFGLQKRMYLYAVLFSALYAVTDEVHQFFVPGRAMRFLDVCIDTAGAALAAFLWFFVKTCKKNQKLLDK